jgi:thioredoxin reductase (NADPH)
MKDHGTKIIESVTPQKVEKVELEGGKVRYRVTLSDGTSDEYDTVLVATGRYADLKGLNIEALNLRTDPKSGKLLCVNEQTNVPHVYAIGDVVHGTPELTPVAIMAGRLLAKRLFGGRNDLMVYKDIATAVFTPLEFGTVGYSEDDAIAKFGAQNIDCYVSSFTPLEWSVTKRNTEVMCFAKIVVDTSKNNKIVGLHIASPNAGEIIQGYAAGFRKGMTYDDLMHTVGIHPTIAEEFTTMEISKSSGADSKKAGC